MSLISKVVSHLRTDVRDLLSHVKSDVNALLKSPNGLNLMQKFGSSKTDSKLDVSNLDELISAIRGLSQAQREDLRFIENDFIPWLGLNNEQLHEQPDELKAYMGTGLRLWQYPNQLAPLLVKLAQTSEDKGYLEIGSRWGGTFVLLSEWLFAGSNNKERFSSTAVDLIVEPKLISDYAALCRREGPTVSYVQGSSRSPEVVGLISQVLKGTVLIDGDHSTEGALWDHLNFGRYADRIIHHDVDSDAVPNLRVLWGVLQELETAYSSCDFVEQYKSVNGSFLGIGLMEKRR